MSDDASILPEGESLRRAVRWISERRQEEPDAKLLRLIEEASLRYDLSPAEEAFLIQTLTR
jgi:hypothetical protein